MSRPPPQLEPSGSLLASEIVRAGAGAGKTTRLAEQVLAVARLWLEKRGKLPRMVVCTFTRKATQELRERLMLKAVTSQDEELIGYVNTRSQLAITTIHGILIQFLTRYSSFIDLDPAFRVVDGRELYKPAQKVVRELLLADSSLASLLECWSFRQLTDLCLQYEAAGLNTSKYRPYELADYETQAQQAARHLINQISELESELGDWIQSCTEKTAQKWQEFIAELVQIKNVFDKSPWAEARRVASEMASNLRKPRKGKNEPELEPEVEEALEQLRQELKELGEWRTDPEQWQRVAGEAQTFGRLAEGFCERFRRLKYRQGTLLISDIEAACLDLVQGFPNLARAFSQTWDYWLVDEYQDTSPSQVRLLDCLMGDRPHFIVGDPQQSIYLFRGARVEVFAGKEEHIRSAGGQFSLQQRNYRSRPELLHFINDLFTSMKAGFSAMEPRAEEHVAAEVVAQMALAPNEEAELKWLAQQVAIRIEQGTRPEEIAILARTNRQLSLVSRCLSQQNIAHQVHSSSGFFLRREVRDALALLKFLLNPADNASLACLLRSPWFCLTDTAITELRAEGSGPKADGQASGLADGQAVSLWTQLARQRDKHEEVFCRLQSWRELVAEIGVARTWQRALLKCGLFTFTWHLDPSGRREANLWKLSLQLFQAESQPGFNPLQWLSKGSTAYTDYLEPMQDVVSEEADAVSAIEPDRVNLMTVHSSKGLQFAQVFVPFCGKAPQISRSAHLVVDEERERWSVATLNEDDHSLVQAWLGNLQLAKMREREYQESLRLFYVAVTRAQNAVFLSWSGRPQSSSWANNINLPKEPGSYSSAKYSYRVLLCDEPNAEPNADLQNLKPTASVAAREADDVPALDLAPAEPLRKFSARRSLSVSQILRSGLKSETEPSRPEQLLRELRVSHQGTLLHQLFELLKYQADVRAFVQRHFADNEEEIALALEFVNQLREPPMVELLRTGQVEWPFAMLENGCEVHGKIDLWGADRRGVLWLIDYKTGISTNLEQAFAQLEIYSLALTGRRGSCEVKLSVVHPLQQKIFTRSAPEPELIREKYFS